MIQNKSFLPVSDNSGAKYVRCLKVLECVSSKGKKKTATAGDIVLVSIRFCLPEKKVKKGLLFKALIVRVKNRLSRQVGFLSFDKSFLILLDKKMQPLGTKVFGPITREIRLKDFNKLSTLAKFVI